MQQGEKKTEFIAYESSKLLLKRKTQLEMNKDMKMNHNMYKINKKIKKDTKKDINHKNKKKN